MVFTLGLRHTLALWQRAMALVQFPQFRYRSLRSGRCRKNLSLCGNLMQFSIRSLLTLVAFTALGIAAISVRARPLVAVLSLSTTIWILYAFLACFLKHRKARTYWIGFVVFSFGYFFWMGGPGNREFYSVPGVVTEWLSGPAEIYSEYSRYDAITYPTPVAPWRENQAIRGRVRYSANCIAAIYLGVLGGWIAVQMKGGTEA